MDAPLSNDFIESVSQKIWLSCVEDVMYFL